jgi:endonuclease/exonuclease/phosphatase family metal-dependent hydrolase
VFNVHLSPHDDAPARRVEAGRVAELAGAHDGGRPLVVAGDFNDADDHSIIDALPGVEHVHPGSTNPADAPSQTLDHVLLPADAFDVHVDVPDGGARWAALSDHLPVTVRFCLP